MSDQYKVNGNERTGTDAEWTDFMRKLAADVASDILRGVPNGATLPF